MTPLRLSLLQTDIAWENKQENLRLLREKLENLRGKTEIVVLPEMFSTGFSMNPSKLAEPTEGETITTLKRWASEYHLGIAGSYIACVAGSCHSLPPAYYNRAFFLTPEGEAYFRDKRHLFRMGHETQYYNAGNNRDIISYHGWNIRLLVCYDLRFPVWSRNSHNEYDLLIYVANWPASRRKVWDILLQARALENISYVCGVNRIGRDGQGIVHDGGSAVYSPKGERLGDVPDHAEGIATIVLDLDALQDFRQRFPAWKDADAFSFNPDRNINY